MSKPSRRNTSSNRASRYIVAAVVGVVIITLVLVAVAVPHHTKPASVTPQPSATNGALASAAPGHPINPATGVQPSSSTASTPTPTPASTPLPTPSGQLYSTAPPVSLSANPLEESVCNTVAGAACDIVLLAPNGTTTQFAAPAVSGQGSHLVDWHLKQYISTIGDYKIYATATLNGQSSSSPKYDFEVTQ